MVFKVGDRIRPISPPPDIMTLMAFYIREEQFPKDGIHIIKYIDESGFLEIESEDYYLTFKSEWFKLAVGEQEEIE